MRFNQEFDASGLLCPIPIIKTKQAMARIASGEVLRVVSTDPGSVRDMKALATRTGNTLLEHTREDGKFVFYLRKA